MVKDMTRDTPWKCIVFFALPLLFGNIFQQAYNLIDVMIVGQYAGPNALSGVGIASPIFNLINALMIGLSVGASILISQLFGAKEFEKIHKAVSTMLITSVVVSIVLTVIGFLCTDFFLELLKTPASDLPYARAYLRIIIAGLIFTVFYNQFSGLLRGLGNAKTPLYFLIFSSVLNIILDYLFVAQFQLGVKGAAIATIISQGISAILTGAYILRKVPELSPKGYFPCFDRELFHTLFRFGLPMGFQQASISLGHVLMQGIVNPFGTAVIAAYASAVKIDMFAVMPIISLGSAASTFSAQNSGNKDYDRVRKGYRTTNLITLLVCMFLTVLVLTTRHSLMALFISTKDYPDLANEIIQIGVGYLSILPCFYVILGFIHSTLNTMAGAGDTKFSMISMIGMMLLRVLFAFLFIRILHMDYHGIWWAFPVSWIITLICVLCYYRTDRWMKKSISKNN